MSPDPEYEYLWARRCAVKERAELSVLYHRKRERAFDLADRWCKAIAVVGGTAALTALGGASITKVSAAAIAVTSTFSLVFSFSDRSRRHAKLAHQFCHLEASILAKGERTFDESDVDQWEAEALRIEAEEPPALSALVVICQNEIAVARDQLHKVVPIGFWRRQFAPFLDIPARPHRPVERGSAS